MPKYRLRLRTLMILVAVVALVLGGWIAKCRYDGLWKLYNYRSGRNEWEADWAKAAASNIERDEASSKMAPHVWYVQEISRLRQYDAYHRMLSLKYRAAADRPWMPVSADPNPPDEIREIVGPTSW